MAQLLATLDSPIVEGTPDRDRIWGSQEDNTLRGYAGDDLLQGRGGYDFLDGGDGNDTLIGGVGADTLTGGAGIDIFVLQINNEGIDIITDFNPAEDKFDFAGDLPPERFSFQPGINENAGNTLIIDSVTGETIAMILGVAVNATSVLDRGDRSETLIEALAEESIQPTVTQLPITSGPAQAPPSMLANAPLQPPPTDPPTDPPPPPLDLTGRLSANSTAFGGGPTSPNVQPVNSPWPSSDEFVENLVAQFEAGLITESAFYSAITAYYRELNSRPGWSASTDDFTIETANGEYFSTFAYTGGGFAERVNFAIDPNDFSGLGFSEQLYFAEEISQNNRFRLDFVENGYTATTVIFGDLVGSVSIRYTYDEPPTDPITNPNLQAPHQGSGDTYNTGTWDEVQFDENGWTATDHDFRIGNLAAPDFRFGFPLNIPMYFPADDLSVGDQIEISPDYSTFASEISGFRFFPTEQPTVISEQTDPVTATLIRPTNFIPGIPTDTLALEVA